MLLYKEFYKKHGIRLIRNLLDPIAWKADVISYPKQTMLIWSNGSLTTRHPSAEYGYFKNLHTPFVYTILEYHDTASFGASRYRKVNESKLIKELKLTEPKFKYIRSGKQITIPVSAEVLINLGSVNKGYKYSPHPLNAYYVWANTLTTAVNLATPKSTGVGRHKMIFMDLPYKIPNRAVINKHLNEPTRNMLGYFPDQSFFNLLELFRFISSDNKKDSIIANGLSVDEFKYVDIVFIINNKMAIINLELLASITDAYIVTSNLKKYASDTVNKIIYIFLNKLLEASPVETIEGVAPNTLFDVTKGPIVKEPSVNNVILDDVIKNEVSDDDDLINSVKSDDELISSGVTTIASEEIVTAVSGPREHITEIAELTNHTRTIDELDSLKQNKLITKKSHDDLVAILENQATKPSPYNDGTTIGELITMSSDDVVIDDASSVITDTPSVLDKTMNKDVLSNINKTYRDKGLRKDIMSTIYAMQRTGIVIKDHEVTEVKSILGRMEKHKLTLQSITGDRSTVRINIPVVNDDNTITMSGNSSVMRRQRADIPIKKISNTIVSLNSYYGKLFISKATYKRDDLGFWFHKKLMAAYDTDNQLKDVISMSVVVPESPTPKHYGIISRYVKGFTYKGIKFNFDYNNRSTYLAIDAGKYESKNSVVVGVINSTPVIMTADNELIILDKTKTSLGTIFNYLKMDLSKAPIEYCNAKIYKEQIPLGLLLSYYLGLNNLLNILNIKYTISERSRVTLDTDQYRVIFSDKTYVINRDYGVGDLVIAGLVKLNKYTKLIIADTFSNKSKFTAIFTAMGLPLLYVNEMKLMENMFIDPVTKQVLELFKLPTSLTGVLIKAADMLQDDNYKHPNSLEGVVLKGYERISGILYLEIVNSLRLHANRSHFGKSKISISPYAVTAKINEDSTMVLVDDLNPIASLKQHEDVTYLGIHGRKEVTMSASTRIIHPSEIGVISEAVKDSGAVGISAYLSATPNLTSTRGTSTKIKSTDGWSSRLSTSAMLAPFGTKDDPKRLNFVNIMNAHIIPMANMEAPYVRTGAEAVVAARTSKKFVISAEDDGVVISSDNDSIVVKYKTNGRSVYKFKEWTSKEEAGVAYLHKQIPNLKKGVSFKKHDSLSYDPSFFEPDIFNSHRVIYKMGASMNVATMEAPETYEDSSSISEKLAKRMGTSIVKIKSIVVNNTDSILRPLKPGANIEPKDPLLSIADENLSNISELDNKALDILKDLKMLSPKAGYRGVINKVRVFYNCELKDLSPTLRKLANISDSELLDEVGYTGQVTGGYSIKGKPLLDNEVEIKYYIKVDVVMGTGDKAVIGNQLKFTVGSVYSTPVISEAGTEIDCITSARSIEARIVNSPGLIGTTSKLLELLTDKVVNEYFV